MDPPFYWFIAYSIFQIAYFGASAFVTHLFREADLVQRRVITLTYYAIFASAVLCINMAFYLNYFLPVKLAIFPCAVGAFVMYLASPIVLFCYYLRASHLAISFYSTHLTTKDKNMHIGSTELFFFWLYGKIFRALRKNLSKLTADSYDNLSTKENVNFAFGPLIRRLQKIHPRQLSRAVLWMTVIDLVLFLLVLAIDRDTFFVNPIRRACGLQGYLLLYLVYFIELIALIYCLVVLRKVKDSLGLTTEIQVCLFFSITCFILWAFAAADIPPIASIDYAVGANILLIPMVYVLHFMTVWVPIGQSIIEAQRRKTQIGLDEESFQRTLNDEALYAQLRECLADELCMENALYIEKIKRSYVILGCNFAFSRLFKKNTSSSSSNQDHSKVVKDIYEEFIKPNSPYELNIPFHSRVDLEKKMNAGNVTLQDLEHITNHVTELVFVNTFPRLIRKITKKTKK